MSASILCHRPPCKARLIKAHCPSPACPWAVCPEHGTLALTAEQRRFLRGEDA